MGIIQYSHIRVCGTDVCSGDYRIKEGITDCGCFSLFTEVKDGIFTQIISAKTACPLDYIEFYYDFNDGFNDGNLFFYNNVQYTNDVSTIGKFNRSAGAQSADLFLFNNKSSDRYFGVGYVSKLRFHCFIKLTEKGFCMVYDMEGKPLVPGTEYRLERFITGEEKAEEFLKRYADTVAVCTDARPLREIPTGWCSWSCYYKDVNEEKILRTADGLVNRLDGKKAKLVQIDDGWQRSASFPGIWEEDREKFPDGIAHTADRVHDMGLEFGLWLAPMLISESSEYYNELKHMAVEEITLNDAHPFDLDNPEYYEHLSRTFKKMTEQYHAEYFKLDFLAGGYRFFKGNRAGQPVRFKTDYCVALVRKVFRTIREAVGNNVVLLSCGAPILECAGIFDAQRASCDIIWGKSPDFPSYWQIIKNTTFTILHRYFYNDRIMLNDPDGAVMRDYDCGDGFNCTYSEAKLWSATVALSGGSVLHNEEIENLSPERRKLFTRLLPACGIAAHPVDFFESPEITSAVLDYNDNTKFLALYNYGDKITEISYELSKIGLVKSIAVDCFTGKFIGICDTVRTGLLNPHDMALIMLREIPSEPAFLYSDGNIFLGQNQYAGEYRDGKLNIKAIGEHGNDRIYAYYPSDYEAEGRVVKRENEYTVIEIDWSNTDDKV